MRGVLLCLCLLTLGVFAAGPASSDVGIAVGSDSFSYPDGTLNGNGPWTGSATAAEIAVVNGEVQIISNAIGNQDAIWNIGYSPANGTIWVRVQAKAGAGNAEWFWDLYVDDAAGVNLGRFYGKPGAIRGRIGGTGSVTNEMALGATYGTYEMLIDTTANTTTFYTNGNLFDGTATHSHYQAGNLAGDVLGRIRFNSWNRGNQADTMSIDNLAYGTVPEPSSLVALGTLGLGALGMLRRRKV